MHHAIEPAVHQLQVNSNSLCTIAACKVEGTPKYEECSTCWHCCAGCRLCCRYSYLLKVYNSLLLEAIQFKWELMGQGWPQALELGMHVADSPSHGPLRPRARPWHQG